MISKLADASAGKTRSKADNFVPYRDSVLTWLLKVRGMETLTHPGYISRTMGKFKTGEFDKRKKQKFSVM